ncbi:TetR/AcrR family transcriptional regulator [Nakamurella silvestris]|nr:TetR/AcrR family transcriptional regulator [Nakamurella silvestris]
MTSVNRTRPLRADAQRNRDKVLAAAVEGFAAGGPEVPLESIAKRAGVGIGTLYRHFPTRDALVLEAYGHEVEQLCAAAAVLLAADPPDLALREWMDRFVAYVAAKRGMSDALRAVAEPKTDFYAGTRESIVAALDSLLRAGAGAGVIRSDVPAEDLYQAMSGVWSISAEAGWRDQAGRLLDLLMDGLRFGAEGRGAR